jgi:hypothetical protein
MTIHHGVDVELSQRCHFCSSEPSTKSRSVERDVRVMTNLIEIVVVRLIAEIEKIYGRKSRCVPVTLFYFLVSHEIHTLHFTDSTSLLRPFQIDLSCTVGQKTFCSA